MFYDHKALETSLWFLKNHNAYLLKEPKIQHVCLTFKFRLHKMFTVGNIHFLQTSD